MTVNEMLYEAITTESRKRKCRWQTELEALGFEVSKNGAWFIRNTKTGRFIELPYDEHYIRTNNGYIKFGRIWSRKHEYVNKPLSSIDLEGLLIKRPVKNGCYEWTDVMRLKDALRNKKYHSRILDNAMSEYQHKIDALTKEYQRKLEQAKHSYDWDMKYHTDSLASANKIISELLYKTA